MARAGMTRWRSRNCAPVNDGCDEVQKSLDLLDRVLSEFDDFETSGNGTVENAHLTTTVLAVRDERGDNLALRSVSASKGANEKNVGDPVNTPEDESLCSGGLGGHQSEDDGYMSMNGRKAKLMLMSSTSDRSASTASTSSSIEYTNGDGDLSSITPDTPPPTLPVYDRAAARMRQPNGGDFPPPPEEAERIISTLLPRVSPCSSSQRKSSSSGNHANRRDRLFLKTVVRSLDEEASSQFENHDSEGNTIATQTTLPKTKHQRPYGWDQHSNHNPVNQHRRHNAPGPAVAYSGAAPAKGYTKYGSLPHDGPYYQNANLSPWLSSATPPRAAFDHHREVRRGATEHDSSPEEAILNTVQELTDDDPANFSDDSLEDAPPPPPAAAAVAASIALQSANKRGSIAWEVSLDSEDEGVQANKNKHAAQGRKKSGEYSSTGSLGTLDWPAPPNNASDLQTSDADGDSLGGGSTGKKTHFNGGTYVIRKCGRKDRMQLLTELKTTPPPTKYASSGVKSYSVDETDLKRCSSTFDNIKTLLKEGLVEGLDDSPPDFQPPRPPNLSRGISLPNIVQTDKADERDSEAKTSFINESVSSMEQLLENEDDDDENEDRARAPSSVSKSIWTECDFVEKQSVAVQVSADFTQLNKEIAEQSTSCQTDNEELDFCVNKAMNTAVNITSTGTFKRERKADHVGSAERPVEKTDKKKELKLEIAKRDVVPLANAWNPTASLPETRKAPANDHSRPLCNGFEKPRGDFRVNVEILQHEFGPLPPSPVEEVDEYADVLQSVPTSHRKSDSLSNDSAYRRNSRLSASGSIRTGRLPDLPPNSSLKTRSVDAGFTRNQRTHFLSSSRKEVPVERRTLPTDLPGGTGLRRPFQKRSSHSPKEEKMQLPQHSSQPHVSCSLPETPIFARGCDIPRTPLRNSNTADKTNVRTTPRLNGIQMSGGFMRNVGAGHGTCLGEAMAGAELLRLTGPGRGWYPRHRQPRPASVEHLDRLAPQGLSPSTPGGGAWETRDSRKPLTLPPNLSPKFFQRSPREALRRVTSLLIRKGGSTKDTKSKDVLTSSVIGPHGDFGETTRQQKRGFFRGFWKRSRHYSLDPQQ